MGGSIRDAIKSYSPKWLQSGTAEKLLYTIGYSLDLLLEKANQAAKLHIPTYGDASALPTLGADRLITQGPNEGPANYAQRLKLAYDDWASAGSPRSVLQQLLGYLSPYGQIVRSVGNGLTSTSGTIWQWYAAGASYNSTPPLQALANTWNWDGAYQWWRTWVIIDASSGLPFTCPKWGDGHKWGDGTALGISGGSQTAPAIRSILALWKPAHATVVNVIVSYGSGLFLPTNTPGGGNPDGTWGTYYKLSSGAAVPSRSWSASYLDGV